ncbi:MAG: hypothetical protein Q7S33_00630 [Nanoarchaeota archaeon]|nr:hypothetical protein [Nanoarchaeota archaeon]
MSEEDDIKRFILRKLVRHRIWMHKHTSIHNLPKGLPDFLRSGKGVKKVIEEMLKQKFLLSKPTNYGLEVSLNIDKKKEIEEFIFD